MTVVNVTRTRGKPIELFRRLPPGNDPVLRLNGLCPYYTMFPLSFPFSALQNAEAGTWVLDPFCGRGTTVLATRLRGLHCVGIDSNPVAAAISAAKLTFVKPCEVVALAERILTEKRPGPVPNFPQGDFWESCYDLDTLRQICRIRNHLLDRCTTRIEIALRGLMLGILHGPRNKGLPTYLSNQMPRTYSTKPDPAVRFWRKNKLKPVYVDVLATISKRAVFSFRKLPQTTLGYVVRADSRKFNLASLSPRYSWVITSPPYYGMRTYFPDHWLRNWFLGGPDTVDYQADEQLCHHSEAEFISDLASVWRNVAKVCLPGAKLVCRFGAVPSRTKDPRALIRETLQEADRGWRITTIRDAGTSRHGRRQCEQFGSGKNEPVMEIDVYATLEP